MICGYCNNEIPYTTEAATFHLDQKCLVEKKSWRACFPNAELYWLDRKTGTVRKASEEEKNRILGGDKVSPRSNLGSRWESSSRSAEVILEGDLLKLKDGSIAKWGPEDVEINYYKMDEDGMFHPILDDTEIDRMSYDETKKVITRKEYERINGVVKVSTPSVSRVPEPRFSMKEFLDTMDKWR